MIRESVGCLAVCPWFLLLMLITVLYSIFAGSDLDVKFKSLSCNLK